MNNFYLRSVGVFSVFLVFLLWGGVVEAADKCPVTRAFLFPPSEKAKKHLDSFGHQDRLFVSISELNGYLDGVPRLRFRSGSEQLPAKIRTCLGYLGKLYQSASKDAREAGANGGGLLFIGHTDPSGSATRNYTLSAARAWYVARVLTRVTGRNFKAEGRGAATPWFCSAPINKEEEIKKCAIGDGGPSATAAETTSEDKIDQDRRVEIRFVGSSIAGPRLGFLSHPDLAELGISPDSAIAYFAQRMRYYPEGTTPLSPVVLELGGRISQKFATNRCAMHVHADTGWTTAEARNSHFDEDALYARLRIVPVVPRNGAGVQSYALELLLATGLVAPVVRDGVDTQSAVVDEAPPSPAEKPHRRHALGLGVPDYWVTRLRLKELLDPLLQEGTDIRQAIDGCWPKAGSDPATWLTEAALTAMPRDFEGLLGEAYDYERRTRMFGLHPGHHLRVMAGGYSLRTGLKSDLSINQARFGVSQDLYLYRAPTAFVDGGQKPSGVTESADLAAKSGPEGFRSVSLDPALQLPWLDIAPGTDTAALPLLPMGAEEDTLGYYLDDPFDLERFLRGRVVRVFQPGPSRNDPKGVLMRPNDVKQRRLIYQGGEDGGFGASDLRDTILVGAPSRAALEKFALLYRVDRPASQRRLASNDSSLCYQLMHSDGSEAVVELSKAGVRCGFFRQNVHLSLLLNARIDKADWKVPVGSRIGAFAPESALKNCFQRRHKAERTAGFEAFPANARPDWSLEIRNLGGGIGRPDNIDMKDCRLLALPILEGGRIRW